MIYYLNFQQEYMHMKCLLFDDLQPLCLSFMRKPKVYDKNIFSKVNSKSTKKLKEIILFFKNKRELSQQDQKMYELLSEDVKSLIKNFKAE